MIKRELIKRLSEQAFKGKLMILLGARQVGKTTLLKQLVKELNKKAKWFNAEEADVLNAFSQADTSSAL